MHYTAVTILYLVMVSEQILMERLLFLRLCDYNN